MSELPKVKNVIHDKWCKFPNDCMCGHPEDEKFTLFWDGPFSQWCHSPFVINSIEYGCAEQYMMAQKAHLFQDHNAVVAILSTHDPEEQKRFGRGIVDYTDEAWQQVEANGKPLCWNIVFKGNLAKFRQNPGLAGELLKTTGTTLVEASPVDTVWGIGIKQTDPRARDRSRWLGKNWLGQVLTAVREELI